MPSPQESALIFMGLIQKSLDNANEAIYLVNESGDIHHCNLALCRLMGEPREEIISKSLFNINSNFNPENWAQSWSQCISNKIQTMALEFSLKSGEKMTFDTVVSTLETGGIRLLYFRVSHEAIFGNSESDLSMSKETLDNVINSIGDPIFVKDRQHRWVLLNDAFCMAMGHSRDELLGRTDYDFFPKHEADVFWKKDEVVLKTGQENINEEEFTENRQVTKTIMTKKTLYTDSKNNKYIVGVFRDITNRKRMEKKLKQTLDKIQSLSLTDELTKLNNRRGLTTLGLQQLKLANRNKAAVALLFVDMDNMKIINDKFGHKIGDKALCNTASILLQTFRDSDIVARIGGDEFVVLAINASPDNAKILIGHLKENIAEFNTKNPEGYKLSLSTGMAFYDYNNPCTIDELLERADQAMYKEKEKKKQQQGR
jgi:diguanylate cyclase (GGDEF)-like protein/PAS domain S-box-containing protein